MNEFYITVFSNACTKKYSNNKLNSFSNDLPMSYNLNRADNWCICLQSIGFVSDFGFYDEAKKWQSLEHEIVRVQCDQIQNQVFNNDYSKDLVIFKPAKSVRGYSFNSFHMGQYIPITNTILDKISLSLRDEKNNLLKVRDGIATFAKLKIKKMTEHFFNLRLSSNDQIGNSFKVSLPEPLYLDSQWRVALTSINYPNDILPLYEEKKHRAISAATLSSGVNYLTIENKDISIEKIVSTINDFINPINCSIKITEETNNAGVKYVYISLSLSAGALLSIPSSICEILGVDISVIPAQETYDRFSKVLIVDEYVIFSNNNRDGEDDQIVFVNKPDINVLKPEYFMLYTNIIDQCIVGDRFTKLLKIIPYQPFSDGYKIEEFKHLEQHTLENNNIREIHIEIRSHTGSLVNFPKNKKVFLNLLFTKSRK